MCTTCGKACAEPRARARMYGETVRSCLGARLTVPTVSPPPLCVPRPLTAGGSSPFPSGTSQPGLSRAARGCHRGYGGATCGTGRGGARGTPGREARRHRGASPPGSARRRGEGAARAGARAASGGQGAASRGGSGRRARGCPSLPAHAGATGRSQGLRDAHEGDRAPGQVPGRLECFRVPPAVQGSPLSHRGPPEGWATEARLPRSCSTPALDQEGGVARVRGHWNSWETSAGPPTSRVVRSSRGGRPPRSSTRRSTWRGASLTTR